MDSDEVLLERARAGDGRAFDALVDRHADRVYAICWRYFGNATDADDAFQATFLAWYRGMSGFRGQAALSTWLYRVATNACHDLARRRARQPMTVPLDDDRGGAGHEPVDQAAVDRLAAAELQPDLLAALDQLDAEQRRAVLLRDVVGASYAEIAAAQHVAVGTAKSRVHRGHARLAEILRRSWSRETGGGPASPDKKRDPLGNQLEAPGPPTLQD